jgi:hypothetical protein
MALTAFPTIVFNTSTGSDSAASGAGPASAVTGTAKASTASTTVEFNESVDLSGVAQDGSHVLWVNGIGFVRISTVDDVNNTLVVETALTIGAGTSIAIGGKRATLNNAESRRLFAATASPTASGASGQWTITLEDDQSIDADIPLSWTPGRGQLVVQGDSASSRRTITQTGNDYHFTADTVNFGLFSNLIFRNTNATKQAVFRGTVSTTTLVSNCIAGAADGTDCPLSMYSRGGGSPVLHMFNSSVLNCTGAGFTGSVTAYLYGSEVSRCGGAGLTGGIVRAYKSIISHNDGDGILLSTTATLIDCTIHGNAGDGIEATGNNLNPLLQIINCQITANTGYGINCSGTAPHVPIVEFCNFGNASDSTANGSGAANGITLSGTNTTVAPGYVDATNTVRNFAIASSLKAAGFPVSTATIGAGQSGTTTYVAMGAAQVAPPTLPAEADVATGETYGYADDVQTGTLAAGGVDLPEPMMVGI